MPKSTTETKDQMKNSDQTMVISGMIAVFWYTEEGVVGLSESLSGQHAELAGRFAGLSICHFDLWERFAAHFGTDDMYFYPRGRVVFDTQQETFKVVCDPKLARSSFCRSKIRESFGLDAGVQFDTDLHYRSVFCSPEFAQYTDEELADPFMDKR